MAANLILSLFDPNGVNTSGSIQVPSSFTTDLLVLNGHHMSLGSCKFNNTYQCTVSKSGTTLSYSFESSTPNDRPVAIFLWQLVAPITQSDRDQVYYYWYQTNYFTDGVPLERKVLFNPWLKGFSAVSYPLYTTNGAPLRTTNHAAYLPDSAKEAAPFNGWGYYSSGATLFQGDWGNKGLYFSPYYTTVSYSTPNTTRTLTYTLSDQKLIFNNVQYTNIMPLLWVELVGGGGGGGGAGGGAGAGDVVVCGGGGGGGATIVALIDLKTIAENSDGVATLSFVVGSGGGGGIGGKGSDGVASTLTIGGVSYLSAGGGWGGSHNNYGFINGYQVDTMGSGSTYSAAIGISDGGSGGRAKVSYDDLHSPAFRILKSLDGGQGGCGATVRDPADAMYFNAHFPTTWDASVGPNIAGSLYTISHAGVYYYRKSPSYKSFSGTHGDYSINLNVSVGGVSLSNHLSDLDLNLNNVRVFGGDGGAASWWDGSSISGKGGYYNEGAPSNGFVSATAGSTGFGGGGGKPKVDDTDTSSPNGAKGGGGILRLHFGKLGSMGVRVGY